MRTDKTLTCIGALTVAAIGTPLLIILSGFVLKQLWGWFVVPTFGLPELSIPIALGLSLTVTMLTGAPENKPKDEQEEWWEPLLRLIAKPVIFLVYGFIVHLFVG